VRLFEARGGPHNCWCMAWRAKPAATRRGDPAQRKAVLKAALHGRVVEGVPIGLLAYDGDRPVAWCSIAPRDTFRPLGGFEPSGEDSESVWSIVCFFVERGWRRQGVTERLLGAAVALARRRGAAVVEAYPVDPDSPSYRFMGFVGLFERAGFVAVARAGTRRHIMRLALE